jgi:hypothetical protein
VALLPVETVRALTAEELPAALSWAERHGLDCRWNEQELKLQIHLRANNGEPYLLEGHFEDYPTLPPSWRFLDPRSGGAIGPAAYPAPANPYPRGSPLIIDGGIEGVVICAHFNRLAFTEEGGPHGDWGPLSNWRNPGSSPYTYADTIGDMLARINLDVLDSAARKAPLP